MEQYEQAALDICYNANKMTLDEINAAYEDIDTNHRKEARDIVCSVIYTIMSKEISDKITNLLLYGKQT